MSAGKQSNNASESSLLDEKYISPPSNRKTGKTATDGKCQRDSPSSISSGSRRHHQGNASKFESRARPSTGNTLKCLDRRKRLTPRADAKDEWALTDSDASDQDPLAAGNRPPLKVKSRNASRGPVPKLTSDTAETKTCSDRKQSVRGEESDGWEPPKTVTVAKGAAEARKTRRSGDEHLVEGLRKRKRKRPGSYQVEVYDTQRVEKDNQVPQTFDTRHKSTESSVIVDLTKTTLSSSQRRQYELISAGPSSDNADVASAFQSTTMSPPPQSSIDDIVQAQPRSRRATRKVSVRQTRDDRHLPGDETARGTDDIDPDEDELAQGVTNSIKDALEPQNHPIDLRSQGDKLGDEAGAFLEKSASEAKAAKRKHEANYNDVGMNEESDFEPERPRKKQTKKKSSTPAKGRKKGKKAKAAAVEACDASVNAVEESFPTAVDEPRLEETQDTELAQPEQTPTAVLQARDANSATTTVLSEARETPEPGAEDRKPVATGTVLTASGPVKGTAAQPALSQKTDRKVLYRVGLSKAARIPSLLRITRK